MTLAYGYNSPRVKAAVLTLLMKVIDSVAEELFKEIAGEILEFIFNTF